MKKRLIQFALALLLICSVPTLALGQSLDDAARQAARQYHAKVLSARTVKEGDHKVHVIRLLTKDGVVMTVRVVVRERKGRRG